MTPQQQRHAEYVKDLVEFVDESGKSLSDQALERLGKLLTMAKGNVEFFLKLVESDRANFMKLAIKNSRAAFVKAGKIGSDFGKSKQ